MVMKKLFLLSIMAFAISVTSCTNDSQDDFVRMLHAEYSP